MEQLLLWLEESRLSVAIAGSVLLYPTLLTIHGIGMSLVVGLNAAISLRVLGVARTLALPAMANFYPVIWTGLWINAVTGLLLAVSAATRVLVDPVFLLKMVFVAAATANVWLMKKELLSAEDPSRAEIVPTGDTLVVPVTRSVGKIRVMAATSFVLWAAAITLGRLMGYTFFRFWQ